MININSNSHNGHKTIVMMVEDLSDNECPVFHLYTGLMNSFKMAAAHPLLLDEIVLEHKEYS